MTPRSRAQILADLDHLLVRFQGRDYSGEVGPETRFFADLGLASIDAVLLAERLQKHYGRRIPFGLLIADLGQRLDRDLTLGEIANFLHRHLGRP